MSASRRNQTFVNSKYERRCIFGGEELKKIDLGQAVSILANVGVIAGIVFLGIELQQNNELLAAEARATRHQNRSDHANRVLLENPGLVELIVKADNGEALSQEEHYTLERYLDQALINWQFTFVEYRRGQFDEIELSSDSIKSYFNNLPGMREYWNKVKGVQFRSDFVLWMVEYVANEL